MNLQHVNVKLLVENLPVADLDPLVPIFHDWIQKQVCEELLLDVADYRHVRAGPGVILIGHEGNYSVDKTDDRLGVRYNRKAALDGSNQERLTQAARAALMACQRLESDPRLNGKFRFTGQELELFINDRLLAPSRVETRQVLEPEIQTFLCKLLGGDDYFLAFSNGDPRRLFSVSVKTARPFPLAGLLRNLAA
jgi:hypothetical protein